MHALPRIRAREQTSNTTPAEASQCTPQPPTYDIAHDVAIGPPLALVQNNVFFPACHLLFRFVVLLNRWRVNLHDRTARARRHDTMLVGTC